LLQVGGDITIRSNWKGYLEEFAQSVEIADQYCTQTNGDNDNCNVKDNDNCNVKDNDNCNVKDNDNDNYACPYVASARQGPHQRTDKILAWTNFERKYDNVGEPTYELLLKRQEEITGC
jgi:tRNA G46 methylase TrmB